jgi:hypothetical protein
MEITNFGLFKPKNATGIIFYENEDGHDWYDTRAALTSWDEQGNFVSAIYGTFALVQMDEGSTSRGVVTHVDYDPSRLVPDNKAVLGIDATHGEIQSGMIYEGGQLAYAPPPTLEEQRKSFPRLTPRQLWLAAASINISKDMVLAQATLSMSASDAVTFRIELTEATTFERTHPAMDDMAALLNIPSEQLDVLWLWAASL